MNTKTKYIISFSGGAASFAAAHLIIKEHGKENVQLVFCDTGIEDEDLYRFIDEAAEKLGCELVKLKDGRTPWGVFKDKRYMGNTRTAHCSVELKGVVFQGWLDDNYPDKDCVIVFGFDWSEMHRHDTAAKNYPEYKVISPLGLPPYLSREDIFNTLYLYNIEIPRLYKLGFSHNNCGGFCVKAGQAHFSRLLELLPDVYAENERNQDALMEEIPTTRAFLRMQVNGKMNYLTLKEFREYVEAGKEPDMFDIGGCGCFV